MRNIKVLFIVSLIVIQFFCIKTANAWFSYEERYAVIVMGGPDNDPHYTWYWNATYGMYQDLKNIGFTDPNIYFLSYPNPENEEKPSGYDAVVDYETNKANVQNAFGEVQDKSTLDDLVYIFWVDHGTNQYFNLPEGNITHAEYNNCIKNISAKVIIGAYNPCYSGAVIDNISRPGVISTTSVNDSQTNNFDWAGHWRQVLKGGNPSNDPSDENDDGYISMAEAYEWIAPKSQTEGEHPWFDDNGDGVGSEYGTVEYDSSDASRDGYIGDKYSLNGWRKAVIHVVSTGNDETGDGSEENPYATIHHVFELISANDTMILVYPGTYSFESRIDWPNIDGIVLKSICGPDCTILDANNSNRHFYIRGSNIGSNTKISGFTFQNGDAGTSSGGSIMVRNGPALVIEHNIFRDNHAGDNNGGAIIFNTVEAPMICFNVFDSNEGKYGGAIGSASTVTGWEVNVNSNVFINNSDSDPDNRALHFWQGTCNADYNLFYNNTPGIVLGSGNLTNTEPEFVDYANRNYHLLTTSPCIDAGGPAFDYSNELEPNGNRVNIGVYGNTAEAAITLPSTSPTPCEDLISNGDFEDGLNYWTIFDQSDGHQGTFTAQAVVDENTSSKVLECKRTGAGGDGAHLGIRQELDINVSQCNYLCLEADVKAIYQSLSGSGNAPQWEYPVILQIEYVDVDGNIRGDGFCSDEGWIHGFYYLQGQNNDPPETWTLVDRNVWSRYISQDLMKLSPKPKILRAIRLYANGWDYTGRIDNVRLRTYPSAGDVSGDGTISAYDAALILQYVVGIIGEFPAGSIFVPSSGNREYSVSIPNLSVAQKNRITVPILINDATGLTAGAFTLRYDPTVLRAVTIYASEILSDCYWNSNLKLGGQNMESDRILSGEIRLAFASAAMPTKGKGALFFVELEALANTDGRTSPLILENVQLSESLNISQQSGFIEILPSKTEVLQNYPNPFNPDTWIPYKLAEAAEVTLHIYDVQGRVVRTLILGRKPSGIYLGREKAAYWDGKDNIGQAVASGIYFYMFQAGKFNATQKLVVQK